MTQRVLLCECDAEFASQIKSTLEAHQLEVEVVGDGMTALERVQKEAPSLIIICVELPQISGYSISNKLKKDEKLRSIPLLITSSKATPEIFDQHRRLRTRADEYLIKPFTMDELLAKISPFVEIKNKGEISEQVGASLTIPFDALDVAELAEGELTTDDSGQGEVVIDDDDSLDDEFLVNRLTGGIPDDSLDADIDLETDAAFAALQMDALGDLDTDAESQQVSPDDLDSDRDDAGMVFVDDPSEDTDDQAMAIETLLPDDGTLEATDSMLIELSPHMGDDDAPALADLTDEGAKPPAEVAQDMTNDRWPSAISAASVSDASANDANASDVGGSELELSPHGSAEVKHQVDQADQQQQSVATPDEQAAMQMPQANTRRIYGDIDADDGDPSLNSTLVGHPGEYSSMDLGSSVPEEAFPADVHEPVLQTSAASFSLAGQPLEQDSNVDEQVTLLQEKIDALEMENKSLIEAGSANKSQSAASGYAHDRELINLREIINRKEREILDLKDAIDAKERQILDQKDKVRDLERKARDMDEKLIVVEKEMVSAREKTENLASDKALLLEREQGTKARLLEAKSEIEKAYSENESLRQRATDLEQSWEQKFREQEQVLRGESAAEIERIQIAQKQQIESLNEQHAQAVESQRNEYERRITEIGEAHDAELQKLQQEHQAAVSEMEARLDQQREQLRGEFTREKEEHAAQLQSAHEQALNEQRTEHTGEIEALKQEMATAVDRCAALQRDIETMNAQKKKEQEDMQHIVDELRQQKEEELAEWQRSTDELRQQKELSDQQLVSLQTQAQQRLEELDRSHDISDKAKRAVTIALALLEDLSPSEKPVTDNAEGSFADSERSLSY